MRGPRRRLSTLERRDLNTKVASLLEAAMVRPLDAGIRTADTSGRGMRVSNGAAPIGSDYPQRDQGSWRVL